MATSYIGADVDDKMTTELAVDNGREVRRYRVATTIPALKEVLAGIGGRKRLTAGARGLRLRKGRWPTGFTATSRMTWRG